MQRVNTSKRARDSCMQAAEWGDQKLQIKKMQLTTKSNKQLHKELSSPSPHSGSAERRGRVESWADAVSSQAKVHATANWNDVRAIQTTSFNSSSLSRPLSPPAVKPWQTREVRSLVH